MQVNRYDREQAELQKILHERDQHRELCESLRKQRLQEFMGGYREISERLKEMYQVGPFPPAPCRLLCPTRTFHHCGSSFR